MIFIISPAKTLDFETPSNITQASECRFIPQAQQLISELQNLKAEDIGKLMSISPKLAQLNYERIQQWQVPFPAGESKQALYAFKGDVYTGIDAGTLSESSATYLHGNLRILSGLYGLLRPTDLILPYRLEMGTKFTNSKGANLYKFWDNTITDTLQEDIAANDNILVNLASNEYFKAVKAKTLGCRIITPIFKDEKNGTFKVISFFAKKARGLMCRYAADQNISNPDDLKNFDSEGYFFNTDLSSGDEWVFTRFEQK